MPSATKTTLLIDEGVAFYHTIGQAVTRWAEIETTLFWIATRCFTDSDAGTLGKAFYAIENFRSKLAFVDRAIRAAKLQSLTNTQRLDCIKRWDGLAAQLQSLASDRNKIVHGHVIVYPHAKEGRRFAILPRHPQPQTKKQATPKPPSEAYGVTNIDLAHTRFQYVELRLMCLYSRLNGDVSLLEAASQREPKPRSLAQIMRQIRTALSLRDKSSP
jgi:hypothetical protein